MLSLFKNIYDLLLILPVGYGMTDLLRTVAAYVPPNLTRAVLAANEPTAPSQSQTHNFLAAVLFADVSGFTPLTEALGKKGREGPEELTRLLNRYFSWMIAFIEAEGGEVVKFGGDALIVVFPAINEPLSYASRRAMQAAKTMQSSMDEFGIMESSVGLVTLRMKFGIGAGKLLSAQVGGVANRWEYIIAGDALVQAAQSEHKAKQGEIVTSPEAQAVMVPENLPPHMLSYINWKAVKNPAKAESVLRCFIPRPVLTWLGEELHSWLATLRPMTVLFVGIKGLDYDQPETIEQLHNFVCGAQEIIYHYQGSLPRLTVDDKGTVLLILFGAPPFSHEDDPERAVRCALELQIVAQKQNLQLSIGVTTGRVFAGPVGGFTRREYTVMGDAVNLAARLMVAADPGFIRCNYETYRSTYGQMDFELLPPIRVKGKKEPVHTYRPTGDYRLAQKLEQLEQVNEYLPMVGRQPEIERLEANLKAVETGKSRIVVIEGEAGIGKSHIVKELVQLTKKLHLTTLIGVGRSIEHNTPYRVWQDIFAAYFGKNGDTFHAGLLDQIKADLAQDAPYLLHYLPLLNDILDLNVLENEQTTALNGMNRHNKLVNLLLTLLKIRNSSTPLILILEDAQWLDRLSWNLAIQTAYAIADNNLPVLLMVVTRPFMDSQMRSELSTLAVLPQAEHLRVDTLSSDETLTLISTPIGLTGNELPEAVIALIHQRAGGNPFFAEEIFYALHKDGFITFKSMQNKPRCLVSDDLDRAAQTLPATIQNTILAQIDQLPPEKQLLLKIATVIGQTFSYTALRETLNKQIEISDEELKTHLDDLTYLGFILPQTATSEPAYVFKHIIIREVTYQSMLFDRRRQLHRTVAQWYENTYSPEVNGHFAGTKSDTNPSLSLLPDFPPSSTPLEPHFSLLVYHWHQAEDEEREQFYAALVGELAVGQYANSEAIGYLSRALDLTPATSLRERYKLFLARETVYDRRGDRERQLLDLGELFKLVNKMDNPQRKAVVALRYAHYSNSIGNYPEAIQAAQSAVAYGQSAQNPVSECGGFLRWAKSLCNQGKLDEAWAKLEAALNLVKSHKIYRLEVEILLDFSIIYWIKGDFSAAKEQCWQTLAMSHTLKEQLLKARCLTLLGKIYYRLGNFKAANEYFERAIPIYYIVGDRRGELTPLYNIGLLRSAEGDYEAARDYLEYALDIAREVNDRKKMADIFSRLGILFSSVGDYTAALGYLGQALTLRKEIGDQFGEAAAQTRLGRIYFNLGDNKTTRRYCELALDLQQKIGDRYGESYTQIYLGHAFAGLNKHVKAISAYQQALNLQNKIGQTGLAINAKIGLAGVHLAQNNPRQALTLAEEVVEWTNSNGLNGIRDPFWVYLKSFQILRDTAKDEAATERVQQLLNTAYETLQQRAAGLTDGMLKDGFLHHIKFNQDIIDTWEGKSLQSQVFIKFNGRTKEKFLD